MTQEMALNFVYDKQSGEISELRNEISEDVVNQFELVGFITRGIDSQSENTWKITETAQKIFTTMYKKPGFIESLKGMYCHYVLKF
ncbi:MAG: hypothetical protein WCG08_02980 [Paludibacter sp.]